MEHTASDQKLDGGKAWKQYSLVSKRNGLAGQRTGWWEGLGTILIGEQEKWSSLTENWMVGRPGNKWSSWTEITSLGLT